MSQASLPLVEADSLSKTFPAKGVFRRGRPVQAVRQIHARIARGEALGVVGESGSGKSTLGRMMLGLLPATSGSLRFDGKEMEGISRAEWRRLRRRMQIVFQDPFSSLDPRRRIGPQIADGMDIHGLASGAEQAQRVGERGGGVQHILRTGAAIGFLVHHRASSVSRATRVMKSSGFPSASKGAASARASSRGPSHVSSLLKLPRT